MSDERKNRLLHSPNWPSSRDDDGIRRVFFDGLPTMAAIVTIIAQPFAQDTLRNTLRLPAWLPIVVAIAVSGLLAIYKMKVVRRVAATDCVICVPVLMLVIFSAYAGGNNIVYYLKEGYTRPDTVSRGVPEDLTALEQEREILQKQLQNAQELIGTLRRALSLPEPSEGKRQSSLPFSFPSALAALREFIAGDAHAQEPDPRLRDRRKQESSDREALQNQLRRYDAEQHELNRRLEEAKYRQERNQATQPKPLIKSW